MWHPYSLLNPKPVSWPADLKWGRVPGKKTWERADSEVEALVLQRRASSCALSRGTARGPDFKSQLYNRAEAVPLAATKPYPGQRLCVWVRGGGGGGVQIHVVDTVRVLGLDDSCSRPM